MSELKYPEDFINKIICGDSLKLIKKIPDSCVDAVFTDPPYGLKKSGVEYDTDLRVFYSILPECYRVLKDNSFFITFFSTKYLPFLFANNPFSYFWQIILYNPEAKVESPIGYTKYMSCFVFKKGNPKLVQLNKDIFKGTPGPGRIIEPDEGYINHPTLKPKRFIMEVLRMFTQKGALVLDPFIGSGSTAVACKHLSRLFIGFEIKPEYCQIANKRLTRISPKLVDYMEELK
jgi:DNA modification methylase